MATLREALLKNGVFYFNNNGNYMVARDSSGIVRYRIEGSELSSNLIVRDISSGLVAFTVSPSALFSFSLISKHFFSRIACKNRPIQLKNQTKKT